jgi:hypothetical protein
MHFFDDAMLAGGVGSLESTVHTDFERTMLAAHVIAPAQAAKQASAAAQEVVRTREEPATATTLALRRLSGDRTGELVSLEQANTMLGAPGGDSALVVKRGTSFLLARFGGAPPRLNRKELGAGAQQIAPRDVIDVGGSKFEVVQVPR